MPAILIALVAAGLHGGLAAVGSYLAGMSLEAWLTLGAGVAEELEPAAAQMLGQQHPSLSVLVKQIFDGVAVELASQAAKDWFAANADKAISLQPGAIA